MNNVTIAWCQQQKISTGNREQVVNRVKTNGKTSTQNTPISPWTSQHESSTVKQEGSLEGLRSSCCSDEDIPTPKTTVFPFLRFGLRIHLTGEMWRTTQITAVVFGAPQGSELYRSLSFEFVPEAFWKPWNHNGAHTLLVIRFWKHLPTVPCDTSTVLWWWVVVEC